MTKKKRPRKTASRAGDRTRQREVCLKLLDQWMPAASEHSDKGLKAGAFVLKVLERLNGLDGMEDPLEDKAPETTGEDKAEEAVDFEELARRVGEVSPLLMARWKAGKQ